MSSQVISIAKNFSKFPAGRFETDGKFSGEACRRRLLAPALKSAEKITIDLRGTLGYGSSFLEEAFGGLVRNEGFSPNNIRQRLTLISDDPSLVAEIWSYIDTATQVAA